MNRKARRAGLKATNSVARFSVDGSGAFDAAGLIAQASRHHAQGQAEQAADLCNSILAREPSHVHALNLLGLVLQESGRHRPALKAFGKALAADPWNAACHYNLAVSCQALGRRDDATRHFRNAITLGAWANNTEKLVLQNPVVASCVGRIEQRWPLPVPNGELFDAATLSALANDLFLCCALETVLLRGVALERFLTPLRARLLGLAHSSVAASPATGATPDPLLVAIAQQCFINEYVFALSDDETRQAGALRELLQRKLVDGAPIAPALLAAVAAYGPLHALPNAKALLARDWPQTAAALVRQQLAEPFEELEDRNRIAALTPVDDAVSLAVMAQYAENPYPRWTVNPVAIFPGDRDAATDDTAPPALEILIAGCGSGQHAFEVAQQHPDAQVLAIDISLPSLAYARRKTREAGLRNVDYAQADILRLGTTGRSFDRIESVGVLHHLAAPEQGWRVLLSMLRPRGTMRIGLYSDVARRPMVAARALIAERGYRASPDDIRTCRQEILRDYDARGWWRVIESADFYSLSGCRDLLFNVMEHRFTLPRIAAFLAEQNLAFLGFELEPWLIEKFQQQFPGEAALVDLARWQHFETENPQTFRFMYIFCVRKN